MPLFQAKIGCKMPRKRGYKNFRSVLFQPDAKQKIPKKQRKNFQNLKNTIMASLQAKIGWKWMRNRENKNYHYVSFQPDEQQKIPKKQQKNKKYRYGFSSQNRFEKDEKKRK